MASPKIVKTKGGFQLKYSNNASIKVAEEAFRRRKVSVTVSGRYLFVYSNLDSVKAFRNNYPEEIG